MGCQMGADDQGDEPEARGQGPSGRPTHSVHSSLCPGSDFSGRNMNEIYRKRSKKERSCVAVCTVDYPACYKCWTLVLAAHEHLTVMVVELQSRFSFLCERIPDAA